MKLFLTSDTHYSHANIIRYCERPFRDALEMDRVLVSNWNAVVGENDVVLHLGDVTLHRKREQFNYIERLLRFLNGRVVLAVGNHDKRGIVTELYEQKLGWLVIEGLSVGDIDLKHRYPLELGESVKKFIHGHAHGTFKKQGYVDVGVDAVMGYMPINALTVMSRQEVYTLLVTLNPMLRKPYSQET